MTILETKYERRESGCWEWTGHRDSHGYGTYGQRKAHRLIYEALVGPIPDGKQLDHLCRNPACVNPAHLEPVTQRENILRGIGPTAVNAAKTHCKRGHPLDGENGYRQTNGGRGCRICLRGLNRINLKGWSPENAFTAPKMSKRDSA